MKFITADYLHNGVRFLPTGTSIVVQHEKIVDVLSSLPNEDIVHYKGLLCPGFINAHCHLELSHLKNKIPQRTGIVDFVLTIQKIRNDFEEEQVLEAIALAEQEMIQNGIVAVGDICNTLYTVKQKQHTSLRYKNFIECVGVLDSNAQQRFDYFKEIQTHFSNASLTPHAPYSVSKTLFQLINESGASVYTIHNQESNAENELFLKGTGDFLRLYDSLFSNKFIFSAKNSSSLKYYLPFINPSTPIILVHNTFSNAEDIAYATHVHNNIYWCTCPSANLYIEGQLPTNYSNLIEANQKICIGTDSLASNAVLSIWHEIETIKAAHKKVSYEELIKWATFNGAEALGVFDEFGSFEKGKSAKFYNNPHFVIDKELNALP